MENFLADKIFFQLVWISGYCKNCLGAKTFHQVRLQKPVAILLIKLFDYSQYFILVRFCQYMRKVSMTATA